MEPVSRRSGLFWKIFPTYLLIVTGAVLGTLWHAQQEAVKSLHDQTRTQLAATARLLALQVSPLLDAESSDELRRLSDRAAELTELRTTIILPSGEVIADSEHSPELMENHAARPEVINALAGSIGERLGQSRTLGHPMMYVAVPVRNGDRIEAVCRTAKPVARLEDAEQIMLIRIVSGGAVAGIAAILLSLWLAHHLTAPIHEMELAAKRLAGGDFSVRLRLPESRELAALASAFNDMGTQLAERVGTITRQNEELQAVLGSMAEGVLAVDGDQRILSLNQAAGDILGVPPRQVAGQAIREVVRNPALSAILEETLSSESQVEGDVVLREQHADRHLQVRGSPLAGVRETGTAGAVLVFNDVTRLKRLETLRRDFAANVSHELRTPITSIQGFAETLLDGALEDREDARRHLGIIHAQARRLNALIGDLLSLAHLETETESGTIPLNPLPLAPHLENASAACRSKADAKQITVQVDCPADLQADISPGLFEEAVANLVDNAVTYSPAGTAVTVRGRAEEEQVVIQIVDRGPGIAAEHLDRLFERFYRVDKGRSRESGGTGLGLAIVKHVAQAHHGRVAVQSAPGQGSTFSIILPTSPAR